MYHILCKFDQIFHLFHPEKHTNIEYPNVLKKRCHFVSQNFVFVTIKLNNFRMDSENNTKSLLGYIKKRESSTRNYLID